MKNATNINARELNANQIFADRCRSLGVTNLSDISDAWERYKVILNDDEVIEYQGNELINNATPEDLLMAKEEVEARMAFQPVPVEEVHEAKVDDTLVYSSEQGIIKEQKEERMSFRPTKVDKARARIKAERLQYEDKAAIVEQAKATGVDPKILARIKHAEDLKARGKGYVKVIRS